MNELPQKWGSKEVALTTAQRVAWWWEEVRVTAMCLGRAIATMPPKTRKMGVVLNPGDPGYDEAMLTILKRSTFYQCTLTEAAVNPLTPAELEGLGSLKGGKKP